MRYLMIIVLCLIPMRSYAQVEATPEEVKQDIISIKRTVKTQAELDKTTNKSLCSMKGKVLVAEDVYGKNYSYCDFEGAILKGTFRRCNFSYSINLDKATIEDGALIDCNLTFADLPDAKKMVNCNTTRLSSKTEKELDDIRVELDKLPHTESIE